MGQPGDAGGDLDGDDIIGDASALNLYGTKVLYRPDDYDYNVGSGAQNGEVNDYYGQFAYYILRDLFNMYALTDENLVLGSVDGESGRLPDFEESNIAYLYDSNRYKVDTIGYVTNAVIIGDDESQTQTELENPFYVVGADLSVKWNWTIEADTAEENLKAFIYADTTQSGVTPVQQDDHVYVNVGQSPSQAIEQYYTSEENFAISTYQELFLSTSDPTDYENYSDLVKALEYVIYCYAVDYDDFDAVTVEYDDESITVQIGDFESVDEALQEAKDRFTVLGSYVGLVDRQITKIQNWVLNNIIGDNALNDDDLFSSYQNVTVYMNESGEILGYNFNDSNTSSSHSVLGRDYQTAVENIISGVSQYVLIGDGVTIDQRFLASEMAEYVGDMFLIADDTNFPAESTLPTHIPAQEYQSAVIMPRESLDMYGLVIALKYDADLDGTEEGVYDRDRYIEIIVDINYYDSSTQTRQVLASRQVKVYDGPYDINYLNDGSGESGDGTTAPVDHTSALMFDFEEAIHVGQFSTDIGGGILMTDVGTVGNYEGEPFISTNPLVLVGTNDARRYYEIVEYGTNPEYDTDELDPGKTYLSGRLNSEMFAENNGSDYIEITYKVIKDAGDMDTNYKFYTGIALVF